jgi:hypothetical protein
MKAKTKAAIGAIALAGIVASSSACGGSSNSASSASTSAGINVAQVRAEYPEDYGYGRNQCANNAYQLEQDYGLHEVILLPAVLARNSWNVAGYSESEIQGHKDAIAAGCAEGLGFDVNHPFG